MPLTTTIVDLTAHSIQSSSIQVGEINFGMVYARLILQLLLLDFMEVNFLFQPNYVRVPTNIENNYCASRTINFIICTVI